MAAPRANIMPYDESNKNAFKGSSMLPDGGGILSIMACTTASMPFPVLAETFSTSFGLMPNVDCI